MQNVDGRFRLIHLAVVVVAAALPIVWLGDQGAVGGPPRPERPSALAVCAEPSPTVPPIGLAKIADGLTVPVYLTHAGDGSGRLFIVEQGGRILIVKNGQLLPVPFLDITDRVVFGGERGLLSVAFHTNYETNGGFYVNYTRGAPLRSLVAKYQVSALNPDRASRAQKVILTVQQPFDNHNGGLNKFGPDGMLYIAFGDGGGAGDPLNSGQRLDTLLGKILRINVDVGRRYSIPPDNPFVGKPGRDQIWAYGFRNPWRFSFDRCDGRLVLADVGQENWEEVDIITKGGNYGWRIMEGAHCFSPPSGCDQQGLILPIHEYGHDLGCSITGGYVYRGSALPDLVGRYIFGDFCSGRIWALTEVSSGTWQRSELLDTTLLISSFGEDEQGELYVVDHNGSVLKIVAGP